MTKELDGLNRGFRDKVDATLLACLNRGVEMRPYFTVRTPAEQARLWRQSRSIEEIESAIARLTRAQAGYLANVLRSVGPQYGPHVTNCLPGLSWHQWGEAVDCFWSISGQAEWSATRQIDGINGYRCYASCGQSAELTAGGFWRQLKDWPHLQFRKQGSPLSAGYTLSEIDKNMSELFE